MRHPTALLVLAALSLALPACGGGGAGDSGGSSQAGPDLAVLFVSGHSGWGTGQSDPSYLSASGDAGPAIVGDLRSRGYTVTASYFIDAPYGDVTHDGYTDLVATMEFVRTSWQPSGTRTVVVAHSHGGVWAHEAIRAVPALQVEALVDLDCNSYLWGTVHLGDNDPIEGDPREWMDVGLYVSWPQYPTVPIESTGVFDSEDLVFPNVARDLEVRSGDSFPGASEWYDEAWNIRTDGTTTGITPYVSFTSHAEVHSALGATIAYVRNWLATALSP